MNNRVGVLVVTYNQLEITRKWIKNYLKLFRDSNLTYLLMLDNNSDDGTYNALRKEFPFIDIRQLNDNYGCTKGRNIGITEFYSLGLEFYCGFDADVFVEDAAFFDNAVKFMDAHPEVDGFGPVLRWSGDRTIQGLGGRKNLLGAMPTVKKITSNHKVHYIQGGASFIRMAAFQKYGFFDNDLPPIGGQDYEWGYRVTENGANLEYNPEMEVIHYHDKKAASASHTREWIFMVRAIFLRKHFNMGNLLREIRYCIGAMHKHKSRLVLSAYAKGMKKNLQQNSFDFKSFAEKGTKRYYKEDGEVIK